MFARISAALIMAVVFSGCFVRGGYYYGRPNYYYPGYGTPYYGPVYGPGYGQRPVYGPGYGRPGYRPNPGYGPRPVPARGPVIVTPPRGHYGGGGRPGGVIVVPKSASITLPSAGVSKVALRGNSFAETTIFKAVDPDVRPGTVRVDAVLSGTTDGAVDRYLDRIEARDGDVVYIGSGDVAVNSSSDVTVESITLVTHNEDSAAPEVTIQ